MQFENTFDVEAPVDEVYAALLDVERVAPCVPGAEVLEQTGEDAYKVAIKVKVGPMSMQYKGDVEIVERDPSAHRAVMRAKTREARGQGTANADVVMHLASEGADRTHGTIADRGAAQRARRVDGPRHHPGRLGADHRPVLGQPRRDAGRRRRGAAGRAGAAAPPPRPRPSRRPRRPPPPSRAGAGRRRRPPPTRAAAEGRRPPPTPSCRPPTSPAPSSPGG